jgi:DNA repair exonuclease SbcCD ATPase subunit
MLTEIHLTNFQAHRDRQLTFVPNVNLITGKTNSGKSSVFRAIRWLVEHKPITGLQTFDEPHTEVTIASERGEVTRFKHPSEGYGYRVAGQTFVACATKQPSEVQATLGLSEINLQGQHDAPFLLTLSPGQMAKELNRIVDLSIIDKANAMAASNATRTKGELSAMETIAEKQKAELDQIAWVPGVLVQHESLVVFMQELQDKQSRYTLLSDKTQVVEELSKSLLALERLILGLQALADQAKALADKQNRRKAILATVAPLADVSAKISLVNTVGSGLAKLKKQGEQIAVKRSRFVVLQSAIQRLASTKEIHGDVDLLLEASKRLAESRAKRSKLERVLSGIADWQRTYQVACQSVTELETKIKLVREVCPTCKRPL